jgi:hypothetical protein
MGLRNRNSNSIAIIVLWTVFIPASALAALQPQSTSGACRATQFNWKIEAVAFGTQTEQDAAGSAVRQMGTVKAVAGNNVTLTADGGAEVNVQVQDSARLVRTAPGQRDLKDAKAITLQEIRPGDRMLARGKMTADGKTLQASMVVVMAGADLAQRQQQELQDWRQRGVGGLVKSVDPATKTVAISTLGAGGQNKTTIRATDSTVFRRYAPDSVKFEEAKKSNFEEIKAGDQLRARGNHNPDNTEVTADEIVFGTFQNLSGTISSTDTANRTITLNDLASKRPVTVKIGADSQMRKLPPMMAQRIAMRFKGGAPEGGFTRSAAGPESGAMRPGAGAGMRETAEGGASAAGGMRGPRGDLQEMLSRLPAVTLTDLQKGDVVMMVATQGSANSAPAAITLLTGVEPILTASPKGNSQAGALLSPWNLGTGSAEAGAAQ